MPGLLDQLKTATQKPKFDPEGSGYDMDTAIEAGDEPVPVWHPELKKHVPHWHSLDPRTGMVLKGRKHPTWNLMEKEEIRRGSRILKGPDGRYYSVPKGKE